MRKKIKKLNNLLELSKSENKKLIAKNNNLMENFSAIKQSNLNLENKIDETMKLFNSKISEIDLLEKEDIRLIKLEWKQIKEEQLTFVILNSF